MNRSKFITGMATGLVVGAAVAMAVKPSRPINKRTIRRTTGKAIKAVGSFVDNLTN